MIKQSSLDYLYKFVSKTTLPITKEELCETLLSRGIIKENDNYNFAYSSDEAYYFSDKDIVNTLEYPQLILNYINDLINRYDGIISEQIILMLKNTFYYLFLDKEIINPNGNLSSNSIRAKAMNKLDDYISFQFK